MSDMEFVVEGKNEASAILAQVQRDALNLAASLELASRRSADATLKQTIAFEGLARSATEIPEAGENAGGSWLGAAIAFGAAGVAAIGLYKGLQSINDSVAAMSSDFQRHADAVLNLGNAIEVQSGAMNDGAEAAIRYGASVSVAIRETQTQSAANEINVASFQELAEQIERVAAIRDEDTLAVMRSGVMAGVVSDQLEQATVAAVGLSRAMGISLSEGMTKARQAMDGNFEAFERLIPGITTLASEQEKLAAVNQLANTGLQQQVQFAGTTAGLIQQAGNEWNNFSVALGASFEPMQRMLYEGLFRFAAAANDAFIPAMERMIKSFDAIQPAFDAMSNGFQYLGVVVGVSIESFTNAFLGFSGLLTNNQSEIDTWADWLNQTFYSMAENAIVALTSIEVYWGKFSQAFELATVSVAYQLTAISANVEHYLTYVLPSYADWFSENWTTAFLDMATATITIFQNLGQNLGEAIFAILQWMESGFVGGMEGLMFDLGEGMYVNLLDGFQARSNPLPTILERQVSDAEIALQEQMSGLANGLAEDYSGKLESRLNELRSRFTRDAEQLSADLTSTVGQAVNRQATQVQVKSLQAVESRVLVRGEQENILGSMLNISREQLTALRNIERLQAANNRKPDFPMQIDRLQFVEVS
jgi:hypothetical protein